LTAYCDSSVLIRFIFEQRPVLRELGAFDQLVTSGLTQIECLRAVENAHVRGELDDEEYVLRRRATYARLGALERVDFTPSIARQAERSLGVVVRTFDAIHLATALQLRDRRFPDLMLATHDHQQGRAALALGFEVLGI
jgi:predicted nucleic acid-binding protein